MNNTSLCVYTTLFHSSVDGHSYCFYLLAVVNNVAMNIDVKYLSPCFPFFWYIHKSGIVGSYGNSVFNFFKKFLMFLIGL